MAIFHLDVKSLSRDAGQSVGAHVAYISRDGVYARARPGNDRDRVLHLESVHMPAWALDAEGPDAERHRASARRYWQAADAGERANARLAVKVMFALPIELSLDQQIELARAYVEQATTLRDGSVLPATWALHEGRGTNAHVHVALSERISSDGVERDAVTFFKRAATQGKPANSGGAKKTREIHGEWVTEQRAAWQALANLALERAGVEARIDARSLADRGSEDVPNEHAGWGPQAEARRQRNFKRRSVNDAFRELRAEAASITNTQATSRVQPETLDDNPSINVRPTRIPGRHVVDAHSAADHLGAPAALGQPAGLIDGVRVDAAARVGARADDEPRADAVARGPAPASEPGVRDMSRRDLDERRRDPSGLLHGYAHDGLDAGRTVGHSGVRREGASAAGESGWVARPHQAQTQAPGKGKTGTAHSRNELINAQRLWAAMGQELAERMEAFAARLAAAKAAKAAGGVPALGQAPSLAKTPSLARLTATSLRPPDKLTERDLREQLQIAKKGEAAVHEQWRTALNARDPKWIAACRAQHAARRARVESLQAEIARREAAAAPVPAPVDVALLPPKAIKEKEPPMNTLTSQQLREQEQIAAAAMIEAGRLASAAGADARAAAKRLPIVTARLKAIRAELSARHAVEAPAPTPSEPSMVAPPPVASKDEVAEQARVESPPVPAPASVVARDAQSQVDALRAVVDAARRRQAERAARAGRQRPDEPERQSRDFDVPGRRRT